MSMSKEETSSEALNSVSTKGATASTVTNTITKTSTGSDQPPSIANGSVDDNSVQPKKSGFKEKLSTFTKEVTDGFRRKEKDAPDVEAQQEVREVGMKTRHVALIAMASGLGTGLLVGCGNALATGGPGALIIGFIVVGIMVFGTMGAAGELAVAYSKVAGGFNAYANILVDPSISFAVAWMYCINWMTVLPLEMVTATMTMKYWDTTINPDVYVLFFLLFVFGSNFLGPTIYAECEFWMNLVKVGMLVVFMISGVMVNSGVGEGNATIKNKYYHDPGAFAHGFKGVCAVFVTAAFSLGGTEFMALTAADQRNPRRAIPSALKQVFYRLVFVYLASIIVLGFIVPYNSPLLMGSGDGLATSPFVIGIMSLSPGLSHFVNAVILLAVLSVANSALYCSSNTLLSLAQQKFAPKWFNYVDRKGRPARAMIVSTTVALFSFIAAYEKQDVIFIWLLSISGLAAIFTWGTICFSHIRFRAALKSQGQSTADLGFRSPTSVYGSWIGLLINVFILVVQFWVSLFPFNKDGKADVVNFFQNYLGMVTFLILYGGHRISRGYWSPFKTVIIPASEVDLETSRNVFDVDEMRVQAEIEAAERKHSNTFKRVAMFLC